MDLAGFDIAPFALPNTPLGEVRFEEPRDIVGLRVEFEGAPRENVAVFYLRKTWPEVRPSNPFRMGKWTSKSSTLRSVCNSRSLRSSINDSALYARCPAPSIAAVPPGTPASPRNSAD